MRDGEGTLTWPDGSSYEGMWLDDKRQGHGLETKGGFEYDGGWFQDNFHGKGKLKLVDGQVARDMHPPVIDLTRDDELLPVVGEEVIDDDDE